MLAVELVPLKNQNNLFKSQTWHDVGTKTEQEIDAVFRATRERERISCNPTEFREKKAEVSKAF